MEGLLNGSISLTGLRESGVNTEVIKKVKVRVRTLENGATRANSYRA
jgi:hypothetical protein